MAAREAPVEVRVWGRWACFTRPEMHVERVSYPVMTPSAARGVLDAIFWKPEIRWVVEEINVLKPIKYASILRNEVNSRQTERTARGWARAGAGGYDVAEDRTQRHTLALRDVEYLIRAQVEVIRGDATTAKYRDQFRRRVSRGQCFSQPYLGNREFTAFFGEPDPDKAAQEDLTEDLGLMLHDLRYDASGRGTPMFFQAELIRGVMRVPPVPLAQEVA